MIQRLQTVPGFSGGRNVEQREQNSGDDLQPENYECAAAENVEPARRTFRHGMVHRLAQRRGDLQPRVEPRADVVDYAHRLPVEPMFAALPPGVGSEPASMKSWPFSIL